MWLSKSLSALLNIPITLSSAFNIQSRFIQKLSDSKATRSQLLYCVKRTSNKKVSAPVMKSKTASSKNRNIDATEIAVAPVVPVSSPQILPALAEGRKINKPPRKLVSIRKVNNIAPSPGSDETEFAIIGGWWVLVKKGDYSIGDLAIYCELDSWIPTELAPFLTSNDEAPKEFNGVKGVKIVSQKQYGQLTQGLVLPLKTTISETELANIEAVHGKLEGVDVTELLKVQKWERPAGGKPKKGSDPSKMRPGVRPFPEGLVPKTDQERAQNLLDVIPQFIEAGLEFEVTEKLEGTSMTIYRLNGVFGVCSRNQDIDRDPRDSYWKMVISLKIEEKMVAQNCDNIAIQGEMIGPKLCGDIYKLHKPEFFVFDCYDSVAGRYLDPPDRQALVAQLKLKHVPVLANYKMTAASTIDEVLSMADGESILAAGVAREGLVFKHVEGLASFKAVSNSYLMAQEKNSPLYLLY